MANNKIRLLFGFGISLVVLAATSLSLTSCNYEKNNINDFHFDNLKWNDGLAVGDIEYFAIDQVINDLGLVKTNGLFADYFFNTQGIRVSSYIHVKNPNTNENKDWNVMCVPYNSPRTIIKSLMIKSFQGFHFSYFWIKVTIAKSQNFNKSVFGSLLKTAIKDKNFRYNTSSTYKIKANQFIPDQFKVDLNEVLPNTNIALKNEIGKKTNLNLNYQSRLKYWLFLKFNEQLQSLANEKVTIEQFNSMITVINCQPDTKLAINSLYYFYINWNPIKMYDQSIKTHPKLLTDIKATLAKLNFEIKTTACTIYRCVVETVNNTNYNLFFDKNEAFKTIPAFITPGKTKGSEIYNYAYAQIAKAFNSSIEAIKATFDLNLYWNNDKFSFSKTLLSDNDTLSPDVTSIYFSGQDLKFKNDFSFEKITDMPSGINIIKNILKYGFSQINLFGNENTKYLIYAKNQ